MTILIAVATSCVWLAACEREQNTAKADVPAVVAFDSVWERHDSLELAQQPLDPLGMPGGVVLWGDQIAVVDRQAANIKVYSLTGDAVRVVGNPGDGPGEFRRPHVVHVDEHGGLLVFDEHDQSLTSFDSTGAFVSKRPSPVARLSALFRAGGSLLATGYLRSERTGVSQGLHALHQLDEHLQLRASMGFLPAAVHPEEAFMDMVFGAANGGTVAIARRTSSTLTFVSVADGSGRPVEAAPPGYRPPAWPRKPLGGVARFEQIQNWANAQTWTTGVYPFPDGRFAVSFSGPGSTPGTRAQVYSVLGADGGLLFATEPSEHAIRPLSGSREDLYYEIEVNDAGRAYLHLYKVKVVVPRSRSELRSSNPAPK